MKTLHKNTQILKCLFVILYLIAVKDYYPSIQIYSSQNYSLYRTSILFIDSIRYIVFYGMFFSLIFHEVYIDSAEIISVH